MAQLILLCNFVFLLQTLSVRPLGWYSCPSLRSLNRYQRKPLSSERKNVPQNTPSWL